MITPKYNVVPMLTTPAGSCLTGKNWQEAGVVCVSYSLQALFIKPGIAYLKSLPDWTNYTGWSGDWVLNASMEKAPSEGSYKFRSPYDGARLSCSVDEIAVIILRLKPTRAILPVGFHGIGEDILRQLAEVTALFVPVQDTTFYPEKLDYGVYYSEIDHADRPDLVTTHVEQFPLRECYLSVLSMVPRSGDPSRDRDDEIVPDVFPKEARAPKWTEIFLESDTPAKDACLGQLYCHDGVIALLDERYSTQFEPLDANCHCPTCEQKLTRAYLHHLLEHTPLLCQRLLIQHNVYYSVHGV